MVTARKERAHVVHRRHSPKESLHFVTIFRYCGVCNINKVIGNVPTHQCYAIRASIWYGYATYVYTSLSFVRAFMRFNVAQFLHATGYHQEVQIYRVFSKRFDLYYDVTSFTRRILKKKKRKTSLFAQPFATWFILRLHAMKHLHPERCGRY